MTEKQHATALDNMKAKLFSLALMPAHETDINLLLPASELDRRTNILASLSSLKETVAEMIRTWEFEDATTSKIDIFSETANSVWNAILSTGLFDPETSNDIAGSDDTDLTAAKGMINPLLQAYLNQATMGVWIFRAMWLCEASLSDVVSLEILGLCGIRRSRKQPTSLDVGSLVISKHPPRTLAVRKPSTCPPHRYYKGWRLAEQARRVRVLVRQGHPSFDRKGRLRADVMADDPLGQTDG